MGGSGEGSNPELPVASSCRFWGFLCPPLPGERRERWGRGAGVGKQLLLGRPLTKHFAPVSAKRKLVLRGGESPRADEHPETQR